MEEWTNKRTNEQTGEQEKEKKKKKCISIEWYGCFNRFVDRANLIFKDDDSGEVRTGWIETQNERINENNVIAYNNNNTK